jgi:hypothetical protein
VPLAALVCVVSCGPYLVLITPEDSLTPPTEGRRPRPAPTPAGHLSHRGAEPRTSPPPPALPAHTQANCGWPGVRTATTRKGSQQKNQSAAGDASEHLSAPHPALGDLRLHPHGPRRLRGGEAPDLDKLGLLGSRHIARQGGRSPPPEAHMPCRPAYPALRHPSTKRRQQSGSRAPISTTSLVRHRPRLLFLRRLRLPPSRWGLPHWATRVPR